MQLYLYTHHTELQLTSKFIEVVTNVKSLVVVAGIFIVDEANMIWETRTRQLKDVQRMAFWLLL